MASRSSKEKLVYDAHSKKSFKGYFEQPKKRKGRPRKRKRGRPKKQATSSVPAQTKLPKEIIDLTKKAKQQLDADVEGTIAAAKRHEEGKQHRINWDLKQHKKLRARIADSWCKKNDLYRKGESMTLFCKRNNISRSVLSRYLKLRLVEEAKTSLAKKQRRPPPTRKKRGRPALLSKSIMRHLCEG